MNSRQKVLLLNPPAKEVVIRDYYCSKTSKTSYVLPPLDLLFASGYLSEDFEIKVIDAVAGGYSKEETISKIESFAPLAIVFMTGAVSILEDFEFLKTPAPFAFF